MGPAHDWFGRSAGWGFKQHLAHRLFYIMSLVQSAASRFQSFCRAPALGFVGLAAKRLDSLDILLFQDNRPWLEWKEPLFEIQDTESSLSIGGQSGLRHDLRSDHRLPGLQGSPGFELLASPDECVIPLVGLLLTTMETVIDDGSARVSSFLGSEAPIVAITAAGRIRDC